MPLKILGLSQASKYFAGYAGKRKKKDRLLPVICWSICRFNKKDPDEVVGQVWDGSCITEANEVDGAGVFVGYFIDDDEGRDQFREACAVARECDPELSDDEGEEEEEEEEDEGEEDEGEDDEGEEEGDDEEEEEEEEDEEEEEEEEDDE